MSGSLPLGQPAELVGVSPALQHLLHLIERVAPTDRPLLVTGPTGSGKELVARRVHAHSPLAGQPFIDVNCGAIPENLIESELFGHVKGAFTGATSHRAGYFELVGKGTLFLDEIGELPLALQPRLLRVLETRSFRPIGAREPRRFQGRVIVATHRNLPAMVQDGRFREDLYYRLAVFVLDVPALAQRREDIPVLVRHFAAQQTQPLQFSPEALSALCQFAWPGNVRQLRNLIDQLGVLTSGPQVSLEVLEQYLAPGCNPAPGLDNLADALLQLPGDDKLMAAESLLIERALQLSSGNKSAAAQLLGVNRKVIERRLKSRDDHCRQAGSLLEQGRQLVEQSAFHRAIPLLRRALAGLQDQQDARPLVFDAHRLLAVSLRSVNGWLCAEACASYEAALQVGEGLCSAEELASMQFGIWSTQLMTLELPRARATAQDMLRRAQDIGSPAARDEAHVAMVNTLFWLGDCEEALACLGRGNLLGGERSDERSGLQGFDLSGLALTFEGLAAYQLGNFTQALRALELLKARAAHNSNHALNHAIALQGAAWLACLFERMDDLGLLGHSLESLAQANGLSFYQGIGQVFRGRHHGSLGQFDEGLEIIMDGYQRYVLNHGGWLFHSFQAWQQGELLLQAGRPADCHALACHALDIALERQERAYLGELQILKARALWAQDDLAGAEQELRSALATSLALGSVAARIAAASHLADLLSQTDRAGQAAETLERALRGLPENTCCPLLDRARQLHSTLSLDH